MFNNRAFFHSNKQVLESDIPVLYEKLDIFIAICFLSRKWNWMLITNKKYGVNKHAPKRIKQLKDIKKAPEGAFVIVFDIV